MRLSGVYFLMLVIGVVLVCFSQETTAGGSWGFGGWGDDDDDGYRGYGGYGNMWGGGRGRGRGRGYRRYNRWGGGGDDFFDFD